MMKKINVALGVDFLAWIDKKIFSFCAEDFYFKKNKFRWI